METVPVYGCKGQATKVTSEDFALTLRETDVLQMLCQALPDKVIARRLCISLKTVGSYLESIYRKLGVSGEATNARCAAILKAVQFGLIELERPE